MSESKYESEKIEWRSSGKLLSMSRPYSIEYEILNIVEQIEIVNQECGECGRRKLLSKC